MTVNLRGLISSSLLPSSLFTVNKIGHTASDKKKNCIDNYVNINEATSSLMAMETIYLFLGWKMQSGQHPDCPVPFWFLCWHHLMKIHVSTTTNMILLYRFIDHIEMTWMMMMCVCVCVMGEVRWFSCPKWLVKRNQYEIVLMAQCAACETVLVNQVKSAECVSVETLVLVGQEVALISSSLLKLWRQCVLLGQSPVPGSSAASSAPVDWTQSQLEIRTKWIHIETKAMYVLHRTSGGQ